MIEIPKGTLDAPGPCWIAIEVDGKPIRPLIKCRCGQICEIGQHHVHENGIVTSAFNHSVEADFISRGISYTHAPGCGWHVWLRLMDYGLGDFPSEL